ncbi:MAG: DUF4178 domain-containing protein [Acidobacteria bacterium]|nr:DUF4178 domain-containing protein [Acidobacteriota bacterium]
MSALLQPDECRRYDEQFAAIRKMPTPIPPEKRFEHSIEDVGPGGYIRFEGKSYRVESVNEYEREGYRWPELVLFRLNDGVTQYLEWEKEDEVSVFVTRRKLTFAEAGLQNKENLWEISEEESGEARVDGRVFEYHEDSPVRFFRDGEKPGTPFHQYLFAEDGRKAFVAVEEWGDEDEGYEHDLALSEYLDPRAIETLATGAAG